MGIENAQHRRYLGDSVYAYFDGFHVALICEAPSEANTIFMEPAVLQRLHAFVRFLEKTYKCAIWPEE